MKTLIKRLPGLFIAGLLFALNPASAKTNTNLPDDKNMPSLLSSSIGSPAFIHLVDSIYESIGLLSYGLEREVFSKAYKGYLYLERKGLLRKTNILTISDYSQSCNNKRLFVIDLEQNVLLFNTYVSHGKNSGEEFPTSFSNIKDSYKSSLGFLLTAETYSGRAGYSMRFDGMESGINDKVRYRDIVLHGSHYVNERVMDMKGVIGKSLGCPAVPLGLHKKIIDAIKGGSCFYINHPDEWYARSSSILNANIDLMPNFGLAAHAAPSLISTIDDGTETGNVNLDTPSKPLQQQ